MKKIFCIILIFLMVTGCSMNRDNIPSLLEIQENGGDWATEKLAGYTADDLEAVWGDAPWTLSGFYGYIWRIPGDWDEVTVYFERTNGEVSDVGYTHVMQSEILEIGRQYVIVRPFEGEWERNCADKIVVTLSDWQDITRYNFEIGDTVLVYHSGMIQETYPAQFSGICQLVPIDRAERWHFQK